MERAGVPQSVIRLEDGLVFEALLMTADVVVPDAMIMTLQRRPELPGHAAYGGWRMHAVGGPVPIDQMPAETVPSR